MSTATDVGSLRKVALSPRAHLFVAMSCASPLEAPSRHSLEGIDEVCIGRATTRGVVRSEENERRRITLPLADPHVSSAHARIVRSDGGWRFEDLGSKNGSSVNGVPARIALLADRDCLRVGHTLLIFRSSVPTPTTAPADLVAEGRVPALATLLPRLASDLDVLAVVAAGDLPVLLVSETGTGKELLARAVHALSRRCGDFVPVNCGGLPPTLVESILFGHKRGAFSGAVTDHDGIFRAASGGTVLLDEIADMPLTTQAALLRTLQDGEVLPVGHTRAVRVDARVVSATHQDVEALVAQGRFREDLLARLSGFIFKLPPLRDRAEDMGLIAGALLRDMTAASANPPTMSPEVGMALLRYTWPRNMRELEKCLMYAVSLANGGRIEMEHLPEAVRRGGTPRRPPPEDELRQRLVELLQRGGGNVSFVAETMHTSRMQVHRWMKRFAIDVAGFRR